MRWFPSRVLNNSAAPVTALLIAVAVVAACVPPASDDPELILTGGVIYPLDATDDPVPALAIRGDLIFALGNNDEILQLAGRYTQQMNLQGSVVLPGTYDAWIDLEALGRWSAAALDLRRASSIEEVQAMVRNAAGTTTAGGWIIGWGWDENDWPTPTLPDSRALDAVTSERPLVLLHRNGQIAWLNGAGLAALPDPDLADDGGGTVTRRPDGIVTGTALAALADLLAGDPASRAEWLGDGARHAAGRGVTHAGTTPVDATTIETLLELEFRGLLPLRVDVRLTPEAAFLYPGSDIAGRVQGSTLVSVTAVGLRLDGPLASRLGALAAPYEGSTTTGLRIDDAAVAAAVGASIETGLPLHLHASGDRAVIAALDAIAETNVAGGMISGFDLLPEEGAARAAGLRVAIAAARFTRDVYLLDGLLGPERAARAHAWSDLTAVGVALSFASDAPAYDLRPLGAMAAVLTRQDARGYPAGGWNASQTVPRHRLVRALIGARPGGAPGLSPGSAADLVVWSEDPLLGDPSALRRAEAMLTIVAGRVAYSRARVELPTGAGNSR